jgi:hypothetical protein
MRRETSLLRCTFDDMNGLLFIWRMCLPACDGFACSCVRVRARPRFFVHACMRMQAQLAMEALLRIQSKSVLVLRMYGGYLIDFHGDLEQGADLLDRAEKLEAQRQDLTTGVRVRACCLFFLM